MRCGVATYDYEFKHTTARADFENGNKTAVTKRAHVAEGGEAITEAMSRWGRLKKNRSALLKLVKSGKLADTVMQMTAMKRVGIALPGQPPPEDDTTLNAPASPPEHSETSDGAGNTDTDTGAPQRPVLGRAQSMIPAEFEANHPTSAGEQQQQQGGGGGGGGFLLRGAFEEFIDAYIEHEFLAQFASGGASNREEIAA